MDNTGYGCGTKLPHNIAALLGVMDGATSDLRTGLPWQMVEIHEPMRLLLQAVGPRVNHYYDRAWTADDDRRSRLVVIGLKGLNRPAIERILAG